jgi:hypothetical protein
LQVTVGADPEFFLERGEGEFHSAIDRIGGIKSAPRPMSREGFFVQEDNVAVEFNIPPAKTVEEFVESIHWAVTELTREVSVFSVKPSFKASAIFPPTELRDPRAQIFGCDPDFNAWKLGEVNPKPKAKNARLRSAGGHIHVGYPQPSEKINRFTLVKLMDLYLGIPSVLMDPDNERRELYGKAGAFRPQDYGLEYRVLSSFWLQSKAHTKWAYEQTMRAVAKAQELGCKVKEEDRFFTSNDLCDDIQACINNGDPKIAQVLVAHHELALV